MPRRTAATLEHEAVAALLEALECIGVKAKPVLRRSSAGTKSDETLVEVAGQRFGVKVKSVVTSAQGASLAGCAARNMPIIVAADRIAADAKRSLREAGLNYFDRRGELRIVSPPLFVDTIVESAPPIAGGQRGSLDSGVAKEVAVTCLLTPHQPYGVRRIARYIGRTPSAVSSAMARLRGDGLLTSAGEAMIPDLFNALLTVWRRQAIPLTTLPKTGTHEATLLELGLNEPGNSTGWALTDTRAAASWGMPIVAAGDYPPDFYVPSELALRAARTRLGEAINPASRACTVAIAPVRLACLHRVDHSHTGEQWPVANHIVVALDIAQDQARGLEALQQWKPPQGIARAW